MKKEDLKQLRSLKLESEIIGQKIQERLARSNPRTYGDTAGDYLTGKKRIIVIRGEADLVTERYVRMMAEKKAKIDTKIDAMEDWLSKVEPARSRNVLRLYYQDGIGQREIGQMLGIDRSVVSRIIAEAVK